ncbi:hypothetical protein BDQ17DRAFT_1251977, partial [Cyathus striatus]
KPGHKCKLTCTDIKLITMLLEHEPCTYLDELQDELFSRHGVLISQSTLHWTLHCLCFSRKTVSARAAE